MPKKSTALKPSLQRIVDAHGNLEAQEEEEKKFPCPNWQLLDRLGKEKLQMKDMLAHLQVPIKNRFLIKEEYVHNMVDSALELLRQYLQEELNTMLRGGKNQSNSDYVRVRNELIVVKAEQEDRLKVATARAEAKEDVYVD